MAILAGSGTTTRDADASRKTTLCSRVFEAAGGALGALVGTAEVPFGFDVDSSHDDEAEFLRELDEKTR